MKTSPYIKLNVFYLAVMFLVLIGDCCANRLENKESVEFWSNNFRILSYLVMGIWYYQMQKDNFTQTQTLFIVSILLPIIISISSYLIPEQQAIIINICVNCVILLLWSLTFKRLGASIVLKDSNQTLSKLVPAFFILPLLFYYFSLYQSLSILYAVLVLIYILIFSYTGLLAAFLPFNEEKRLWITFSIMILVIVNIMNAYHTFLQKIPNAYPILRTMAVISRCMMIYGMIRYVERKNNYI